MFGTQIQRAGLAVATLALAVSVTMAPAAQAMNDDSTDSINPIITSNLSMRVDDGEAAQGVADSLLKRSIEVTYLRKVHMQYPVNKTAFRFTVRNDGNVDSTGVGPSGFCVYWEGGAGEAAYRAREQTPPGMIGPLAVGKSHEFTIYCPNIDNNRTLKGARGTATAYYGPQDDYIIAEALSE